MMCLNLFRGFDEATSNSPRRKRAAFAMGFADDNLEAALKEKAIAALQSGKRDPSVDALYVSCPICGHQISPVQRRFTGTAGRSPSSYVWNEGSEHYVEAHNIVTLGLRFMITDMGL